MENYKAKENKTIIKHSQEVKNEIIKFYSLLPNKDLRSGFLTLENLELAALLHDIGKFTLEFQATFHNKTKLPVYPTYRHNEIGYAFLEAFTNVPVEVKKLVYWHHSIKYTHFTESISKILKTISDEDIETMKKYIESINPSLLLENEKRGGETPKYYTKITGVDYDPEFLTALGILLSADRSASGANLDANTLTIKPKGIQTPKQVFDNERFRLQSDIARSKDKLIRVNAPTGFGKTMLGVMWGAKSERRLIWVCSRNVITEAVYRNVTKEAKLLGLDYSIGMVTQNEVMESTDESIEMFSHDITIINIDSFLNPNFDPNNVFNYMNVLFSDVIFDEYHELINDSPIFGLFVKLLEARYFFSEAKTLLLSATPIYFEGLMANEVQITTLPEVGKHYPAVHTTPFKVNFEDVMTNELPNNTLHFINTVDAAVKFAKSIGTKNILHSYYKTEDKLNNLNRFVENYGKESNHNEDKAGYISTHVGQAAVDVSFKAIVDECISPQATLQRMGRNNRWGSIESECSVTFVKPKNYGKIYDILYDKELSNLWYDFMKSEIKDSIILDELYDLYNKFYTKYKRKIDGYIDTLFNLSNKKLESIFPETRAKSNKTYGVQYVGGNRIRSNGNETFVLAADSITGDMVHCISVNVHKGDYANFFNENGNTLKLMTNQAVALTNNVNITFDYSEVLKNKKYKTNGLPIETFRRIGYKDSTPYISFAHTYSSVYGLCKKNN